MNRSTPPMRPLHRASPLALLCCAITLIAGCAGSQAFRDGQAQIAQGQTDAGLAQLRLALQQEPANSEYRRTYFTQRESAVNSLLRDADAALEQGQFSAAREWFAKAALLDPSNARASGGTARADLAERHAKALDEATSLAKADKLEDALAKTQQVLSENPNHRRAKQQLRQLLRASADATGKELGIYPKLKAAYRVPVSLGFSGATLLQVFEALKQASGLNYMIERDVKPDIRVTLSVTNKPVADIVRLLLATNQLESRVLDDDTLLIYPNTPAKAAEYREMVVRSFYLSNAEANKVAATVRTITKARDVVVDEKLNMLMVRDSAEVIRLVEKVIASQDLRDPEVMLELEVLEVSVNRLLDMGIRWPDSVSASVAGVNGVGQLTLNELRNRNSGMVRLTTSDPLISAQLKSSTGDANLLANPRVRVRSKQTAKILIGERVPVITTTTTANVGSSQSISYLDVGLKLEIEPTVTLDDEVSMKVALEVSNITQTITLTGGTQAYRLGTRNTATSLQVHDGETNILAGLIQRDVTHSNTGIPGLNELPLVNRLFGQAEDSDTRTEIVLLITPHIVRNLDVPGVGQQEFLSGTDSANGAAPIQLGAPARSAGQQPTKTMPTLPTSSGAQPAGNANGFFQPPPTLPQPPAPQFVPPSINQPQTPAPSPGTPPRLTPPTLVPTSPTQ